MSGRGVVIGALAAIGLGTVSLALAGALPGEPSPLLLALLAGALVSNLRPGASVLLQPGAGVLGGPLLRLGIVLLGARGSLELVAEVGPVAIAVVGVTMVAVFTFVALFARRSGMAPELAVLLAVGTAICGNTAVAAVAPLVGARRPEIVLAIGTITLFGTIALLAYPLVGTGLGLDPRTFGIWAGAGIHDTSQVVAAGFAFSPAAGDVATVVKLGRNTLLLPILVGLAILWRGDTPRAGAARSILVLVVAYAAMVAANSAGLLPPPVQQAAVMVSAWALAVAMAAVGISLRIAELRALGRRAMGTGFAASLLGGIVALTAALALRGGG